MTRIKVVSRLTAVAVSAAMFAALAIAQAAESNPAVNPVSRNSKRWQDRHALMNERVQAKKGNVDLLLIGDSITHGWEGKGKEVWKKYYAPRNAINLGIGGDQTQHVIWRLDNGNIEGISPKLAVLMIGTNNASASNTPEQIAEGIDVIVKRLRAKLPTTKVLILGIFPRGPNDQDARRQVNMKANEIVAKFADNDMVFYLDIGDKFLEPDRTLLRTTMPDLVHLTAGGYQIWAAAIEPMVVKFVDE